MRDILKQVAPEFEFSSLNNASPVHFQALDYLSEYAESLQPGSKMANNLAKCRPQTVSVADSLVPRPFEGRKKGLSCD